MFRCENTHCHKITATRQPKNRIVLERRKRTYDKPVKKHKRGKIVGYEKVIGWEIVKEISVCPDCYRKMTGQIPKEVIPQAKPTPKPERDSHRRRPRNNWKPGPKKEQQPTRKPKVEVINKLELVKE